MKGILHRILKVMLKNLKFVWYIKGVIKNN